MASADALTDAGLSADVSAAVAFARSSLDAYENDRRYAAVVHEAVDALERRSARGVEFGALARARRRATPRFAGGRAQGRARPRAALRPGESNPRVPSGRRYVTARDVLRLGRARPAPAAGPARRARRAPRSSVPSRPFRLSRRRRLFRGRRRRCLLRRRRCLLLRRPLLPGRPRFVRSVRSRGPRGVRGRRDGRRVHAGAHVRILQQTLREPRVDRRLDAVQHARAPASISETLRRCTYEPNG